MVACTTADLISSICLLEFMPEADMFTRPDILHGRSLLATENRSVASDLDVDSKWLVLSPTLDRVNEPEKFPDIVSVGYDISRADVERWIRDEQCAEQGFERAVRMASSVLGDVDEAGVLIYFSWIFGWGPERWTRWDSNAR